MKNSKTIQDKHLNKYKSKLQNWEARRIFSNTSYFFLFLISTPETLFFEEMLETIRANVGNLFNATRSEPISIGQQNGVMYTILATACDTNVWKIVNTLVISTF